MVKKEFIPVQVTPEQKEIIKKKAKEKGMTMAAYIRYVAVYASNDCNTIYSKEKLH